MTDIILGLDIGGANLKAATSDGRAVSVPFAVWKHPEQLGTELAKLIGQFPEAKSLAVTMTAELCDCYETKREGVNKILEAVVFAASGKPFKVWSTAGCFVGEAEAREKHMAVAAANWHALATFAGRFVPEGNAVLIDIGSTTTDIIPLKSGKPATKGLTDPERMANGELVYTGVCRTPICAIMQFGVASEFFATSEDAYIIIGLLPERIESTDTADNRPATIPYCCDRLSRMYGGDRETIPLDEVADLAKKIYHAQRRMIATALITQHGLLEIISNIIVSGKGEFLAAAVIDSITHSRAESMISLNKQLGSLLSACAPAYAVAMLAAEVQS